MKRVTLLVAVLAVASSALAGCIGSDADEEPLASGGVTRNPAPTTTGNGSTDAEDENLQLGKRWHFHNYWGTSPVITLFDADVSMDATESPQATAPPPRVTVGAAEFRLPYGSVVPPETGTITVTLEWAPPPVGFGALNVSYRHATGAEFLPAGTVTPGGNVTIPVTLDMTDAPHTSRSAWTFRFTPAANEAGVGVANGTVRALIVAQIGRAIFIDPPHIDQWNGARTVPLVDRAWDVNGVNTGLPSPAPGHVTLDVADPTAPAVDHAPHLLEARVTNGSVVPEGTRTVLARLTWDSPLPPDAGLPALAYAEDNAETRGVLEPESESATERVYRLPVEPRMTDSPYGNQSAWRFQVTLEGPAAAAFTGTLRLEAWATRDAPATAVIP